MRRGLVAGGTACLALALAGAAAVEHGHASDREALVALAEELGAARGPTTPDSYYARAFAGYALLAEARADPAFAPEAARRVDALVAAILRMPHAKRFGTGEVTVAGRRLSSSAVLRGHLALLLVGRRSIAPLPPAQEPLEDALVRGLARDVLADPNHLLPSYGRRTWPADNEVVLAALRLASRDRPELAPAADALAGALASLERDGLPPSEVDPDRLAGKDVPRGCALSWSVGFRALHDRAAAAALWSRYRDAHWVRLGPVVGLREWPRGVDRKGDWDSGPIVLGIGTAASGLGLSGSRLAGAEVDHLELRNAALLAGVAAVERQRGKEHLPRALALWGRLARPF